MSDLTDEMRQLAADGAHGARPLGIAEVIRRGNHRRTRTIAQRSIGGLSAVGLGAAVLFTGVAHHPRTNSAASGGTSAGNTLTVSSNSVAGDITMTVKYRYLPADKIKLVSLTFSGDFKTVTKHAFALIDFGPGLVGSKPGGTVGFGFASLLHPSPHHFSGSLSAKNFRFLSKHGLQGNGSLRIVAQNSAAPKPARKKPGLTAVVILTR